MGNGRRIRILSNPTVITGTVGKDAHVIGTKILSRALREAGFNVVELGILTPPEEFIQAALENGAEAILMSSLYGMGENDVRGFKEKCIEAGLKDVLLYIGGNLSVGKHDFKEAEDTFRKLGFDRVYPPACDVKIPIADLRADLQARSPSK
jgi:methylaspartate mutase S subunit